MLYILNFDIKDSSRTELFTQKLQGFGDCVLFMPRCYFLIAKEDISSREIYDSLKSVLKDEDLFILAPVDLNKMNGWLSSSTIEWLKKNN